MSAWGKGGAAKSCDALLTRVEQNDPTLEELVILSNKTFGDAQADRLAAALGTGKNTHLKSLSASGHALSPNALERLGSAIAQGKSNLVRLAIGNSELGDDGTVALCRGLDSNEANIGAGLQEVDMEWKDLSTGGMAALGRTFGPSQVFQKLNCSRNEIRDEGILAFCASASNRCRELGLAYHSFPSLQELNLSGCSLRAAGIEALVELLGNSSAGAVQGRSLKLNLNGNPLGADACCALASLLCDSPQVTSLSIAACGIGNDGMSILSAAIGMDSCDGVTMLDLSQNGFGVDGARSLASSFSSWTRLNDLRLAGNTIMTSGVEALMNAIDTSGRNLPSLSLDLTQTSCGVEGAAAAVKSQYVTSLRLFNNRLGSEGFETLTPFLQGGHKYLVNLDLGGNDASEAAVVKLLNAIADTNGFVSTLRVLEIGGNSGGFAVEDAVARLKQVHPELDVARDRPRGQQSQG